MRLRFALWLMHLAYRVVELIDRRAVPKATHMTFRFETGVGMVIYAEHAALHDSFEASLKGCRLWYLDDLDYAKAHEA